MVELGSLIILGIFAQWLAWRIKVPAILPLILTGLLVGPIATLFTADGSKWLAPIYHTGIDGHGHGIFPNNDLLAHFVSLAIGIILFEGGLTLRFREARSVGRSILRLISIGSLITFIGAGLADHFIMGLSWPVSFLFGSLIIVTGPTVIAPILQNIPLNRNVATVLKWEGILIDPIGALVAVIVFEFVRSADPGMVYTGQAFMTFFGVILTGFILGGLGGYLLYLIIKREAVPHYLLNVFILAFVLLIFVASNEIAHESGLLSVVVMGLVLANRDVPRINEILSFKESISVLLISMLFILLAANMEMDDLRLLVADWRPLALFGFVALILRPLAVFVSTYGGNLSFREKLFISWVGPRGIVAAGIASLFGLELVRAGESGAEYITPLVFLIVLGTVLINATTARLVAKWLGVIQESSSGVLFIGATDFVITIGKYLHEEGRHVYFVDNNPNHIRRVKEAGMEGFVHNIYNEDLSDDYELLEVGYLLAFTSSDEVNAYSLNHYRDIFGERSAYRLLTDDELMKREAVAVAEEEVFSFHDDFLDLSEANRESPTIHELRIQGKEDLLEKLPAVLAEKYAAPLFVKYPDGSLFPLPKDLSTISIGDGNAYLVYLGQKVEFSTSTNSSEEVLADL